LFVLFGLRRFLIVLDCRLEIAVLTAPWDQYFGVQRKMQIPRRALVGQAVLAEYRVYCIDTYF